LLKNENKINRDNKRLKKENAQIRLELRKFKHLDKSIDHKASKVDNEERRRFLEE